MCAHDEKKILGRFAQKLAFDDADVVALRLRLGSVMVVGGREGRDGVFVDAS